MVRRLPVLQNQPPSEVRLTVAQAVGVAVLGVLLSWAVLLWGLHPFGGWGQAGSFVIACAAAGVLAGSRVERRDLRRTAAWATLTTVAAVWAIAWIGGALNEAVTALLALVALVILTGIGFTVGIAVLLWRRRLSSGRRE